MKKFMAIPIAALALSIMFTGCKKVDEDVKDIVSAVPSAVVSEMPDKENGEIKDNESNDGIIDKDNTISHNPKAD